ncbi:MAG: TRAP transporter large permease [Proteobacteria bacterium]|nr:TRAP transporter large permease [Pseudomonadota bacterium]
MSNFAAGVFSFAVLLGLLAIRVPIAVAMLAVGAGGYIYIDGPIPFLAFMKGAAYDTFANYSFSVIPMFLLMGNVASGSGLSTRLFRGASAIVGHFKGGMAMAAVTACAAFGTICGSSLATAATMGQVAIPEMKKYGYSGGLTTGSLAAGGTLGILVPPSVPLVIYALLTQQNIAKLFLAAFVPAGMALLGFIVAIRLYVAVSPGAGPAMPKPPLRTRLSMVFQTWPVMIIFLVVFVGMNGDFFFDRSLFTPTEGAAIGALCATIAGITVGGSRFKDIVKAVRSTAGQSGMIFLILFGAALYNAFLARTAMPQVTAEWVSGLGYSPFLIMALIVVLYILMGCLMDSLSMILLTIPIFFPVVMGLHFGLSPEHTAIWFGIIALIVVELGLIHPPVGLNVYVISTIARDVPMMETFKGVLPFLFAEFIRVALIIAFPAITLLFIK